MNMQYMCHLESGQQHSTVFWHAPEESNHLDKIDLSHTNSSLLLVCWFGLIAMELCTNTLDPKRKNGNDFSHQVTFAL